MRILMLSSFLPFPLTSGGHVRLYNLIKEISKTHEITLVCEKRHNQGDADTAELKKFCEEIVVIDRKKQWTFANMFATGFSPYPFLLIGHTQSKITEAIYHLLSKKKFDLIHVETFYVMQNLPKTSLPIVLVEHNIEYLVYQRYLSSLPIIFRPLFVIDILKIKYWEQHFWKKAAKVVAVSEHEKKIIGREDTAVVPNGVDIKKFKIKSSKPKDKKEESRVLFIGDFKWVKNLDSLTFVLKDIWPLLTSEIKLWIVGKNVPDNLKKLILSSSNIIFDEDNKEATEDIFNKADILLAPIRVGGGTSFKILEAMASGVPVITTTIGAEGMNVKKDKEILIADTKDEILTAVKNLIENIKVYDDLKKSARKLIEEEYDWKNIAKKLDSVYKSAIK